MAIGRITGRLRFVTDNDPYADEYFVYDKDDDSGMGAVAGPYKTQAQAVFVAYFLNDSPMNTPFAPNVSSLLERELRGWHA